VDAAGEYREATEALLAQVTALDPGTLDRRVEGGWSARQVLHHLADSEAQSYARLRRLLAEPDPVIQGYDEAAWARTPALGYEELPVEHAVAVFAAVRQASYDLLARLTPEDLGRVGRHSESGAYGVVDWIEIYTRHPREHLAQLREAIES